MKFEKYFYGDREVVAFVDESGDPSLRDPGNPVFVLAACVVEGRDLGALVRDPWLVLRQKVLGDKKRQLHMREISHRLSPENLASLTEFFVEAQFKRVSVAITERTLFENGELPKAPVLEVAMALLLASIAEVMTGDHPSDGLSLVFEDGPIIKRLRPHWPKSRINRNDGVKVPVNWSVLDKNTDEPGLEAADFVAHTTGGFMRDNRDKTSRFASRYAAIFPKDKPKLHRGLELNKAEFTGFKNETKAS